MEIGRVIMSSFHALHVLEYQEILCKFQSCGLKSYIDLLSSLFLVAEFIRYQLHFWVSPLLIFASSYTLCLVTNVQRNIFVMNLLIGSDVVSLSDLN